MSLEDNKAIVRQVVEIIWNGGNTDVVENYYAADFVGHWPDREIHGIDDVKRLVAGIRAASLDINFVVEDRIAESDRVLTRFTQSCSRGSRLNGVKPTSKHMSRAGISVLRVHRGKIVEQWVSFDD